eukprot:GHRQ01008423.1.p1 GENE.GHRQ01008423.1~~GHRQ01008423.1.p1  ORF type:complete len:346 (+),score=163.37 GHRQ01008423.1:1986-3023(+)
MQLTSYGKLDAGEEAMQQEILAKGPIVCGIACPEEFVYKYHSAKHGGVYIDKTGDTELDHDVEVVGWGEEEDGLKYWLVRNSWGSYWGSLGFFKLQRGVNALQIESGDCWYANPEYSVETAVVQGELEGSMYGLEDTKGHDHDDDDGDDDDEPTAELEAEGVSAESAESAEAELEETRGHIHDDDDDDDEPAAEVPAVAHVAESAEAVSDALVNRVHDELAAALQSVVGAAVQAETAAAAREQQAAAAAEQGPVLIQEIGQLLPGGAVAGWVSFVPVHLGHACAGVRQAAGELWGRVSSSVVSGAGSDMVQQHAAAAEQQQQRDRGSWGSVLSKRMFGGPQVAVQ